MTPDPRSITARPAPSPPSPALRGPLHLIASHCPPGRAGASYCPLVPDVRLRAGTASCPLKGLQSHSSICADCRKGCLWALQHVLPADARSAEPSWPGMCGAGSGCYGVFGSSPVLCAVGAVPAVWGGHWMAPVLLELRAVGLQHPHPRLPGLNLLLRPGCRLLPYLARHGCEQMGGGLGAWSSAASCRSSPEEDGMRSGPSWGWAEQEHHLGCPCPVQRGLGLCGRCHWWLRSGSRTHLPAQLGAAASLGHEAVPTQPGQEHWAEGPTELQDGTESPPALFPSSPPETRPCVLPSTALTAVPSGMTMASAPCTGPAARAAPTWWTC